MNTGVERMWYTNDEGERVALTHGWWIGFIDGVECGNAVLVTGHSIPGEDVRRMLWENAREAGAL